MNVRFDCTQCGRCCHDLKLPLSVEEAIRWAGRGHRVQLLCDALPDLAGAEIADEATRYRHERSFGARSGDLPIRVHVILVAAHDGPCPHLRPDMRCGNYEERPRVCRIYPAEIAPHVSFDPRSKSCPPEAWDGDGPPLVQDGRLVSEETRALVEAHRTAIRADAPIKALACALLGVAGAALGNEGYAVHMPEPAMLAAALEKARSARADDARGTRWSIVTNRRPTLAMLEEAGAAGAMRGAGPGYIGFFADED